LFEYFSQFVEGLKNEEKDMLNEKIKDGYKRELLKKKHSKAYQML